MFTPQYYCFSRVQFSLLLMEFKLLRAYCCLPLCERGSGGGEFGINYPVHLETERGLESAYLLLPCPFEQFGKAFALFQWNARLNLAQFIMRCGSCFLRALTGPPLTDRLTDGLRLSTTARDPQRQLMTQEPLNPRLYSNQIMMTREPNGQWLNFLDRRTPAGHRRLRHLARLTIEADALFNWGRFPSCATRFPHRIQLSTAGQLTSSLAYGRRTCSYLSRYRPIRLLRVHQQRVLGASDRRDATLTC
jgi:hypothetical protein